LGGALRGGTEVHLNSSNPLKTSFTEELQPSQPIGGGRAFSATLTHFSDKGYFKNEIAFE
jgi:hypothetical protein